MTGPRRCCSTWGAPSSRRQPSWGKWYRLRGDGRRGAGAVRPGRPRRRCPRGLRRAGRAGCGAERPWPAVVGGGAVKVLAPRGDGLIVVAQLQAQGGVPALPSSLAVLQKANGQVEVLVANQGDDTIFVFAPVVVGQGTPGSGLPAGQQKQRSRSSSCRRLGSPRVPRAAPAVPARPERQDRPPWYRPWARQRGCRSAAASRPTTAP